MVQITSIHQVSGNKRRSESFASSNILTKTLRSPFIYWRSITSDSMYYLDMYSMFVWFKSMVNVTIIHSLPSQDNCTCCV